MLEETGSHRLEVVHVTSDRVQVVTSLLCFSAHSVDSVDDAGLADEPVSRVINGITVISDFVGALVIHSLVLFSSLDLVLASPVARLVVDFARQAVVLDTNIRNVIFLNPNILVCVVVTEFAAIQIVASDLFWT